MDSNLKYPELVSMLADTMSIDPKKVRVAYRFSTQVRSDPFSHLSNAVHLMELVRAACTTIATTRSKKEFFVELKDLEAGNKPKGKALAKNDMKKKRVSIFFGM